MFGARNKGINVNPIDAAIIRLKQLSLAHQQSNKGHGIYINSIGDRLNIMYLLDNNRFVIINSIDPIISGGYYIENQLYPGIFDIPVFEYNNHVIPKNTLLCLQGKIDIKDLDHGRPTGPERTPLSWIFNADPDNIYINPIGNILNVQYHLDNNRFMMINSIDSPSISGGYYIEDKHDPSIIEDFVFEYENRIIPKNTLSYLQGKIDGNDLDDGKPVGPERIPLSWILNVGPHGIDQYEVGAPSRFKVYAPDQYGQYDRKIASRMLKNYGHITQPPLHDTHEDDQASTFP